MQIETNNWTNLEISPNAFDNLIETLGTENVVAELAEKYWDNIFPIAQKVKNCQSLKVSPRQPNKIKTIAFYYRNIANGGAQRVTADLCNIFARQTDERGNAVYKVICVSDESALKNDYQLDSRVIRKFVPSFLKSAKRNYRSRAQAWIKILDEETIDIVVNGLWVEPCTFWDLLTIKTHKSHPAFVIHSHNFCAIPYLWGDNPSKRICGNYLLTDGVTALSDCDKYYIEHFCKNARAILNPLPFEVTDKNSNFEANTIVWVGRISAEKRPVHAIEMMNEVVKKIPDAKLYLVGGNGNGKIFDEINYEIKKSHLENNVILTGFSLNPGEFYQKASVFISTAEYEGFCLTFAEAKSLGIPVVSYEMPWLTFSREGSGMIFVRQEDYNALAEKVIDLLQNPEKAKKIGLEGKNALVKMYEHKLENDWEKMFANCFDKNAFPQEKTVPADAKEFDGFIKEYILKWSKNPKESLEFLNNFGFNFKFSETPDLEIQKAFPWPRILIRIAALFIFNKQARKRFRERHLDLTPKDGIDYNALSREQLQEIKRKKRKNRWYRKLLDTFVPVTRAKVEHTERHILEEISRQNAQLRAELRKLQDKINKK